MLMSYCVAGCSPLLSRVKSAVPLAEPDHLSLLRSLEPLEPRTLFSASLPTQPEAAAFRGDTAALNTSPKAVIDASPESGSAPLTVRFDATDSFDPDEGKLRYAWNFGDGTRARGAVVRHTFADPGQYRATLVVRDPQGARDTARVTVDARDTDVAEGQVFPTARILTPNVGTTYQAGRIISFSGTGADPSQGTLASSAFRWDVLLTSNGRVRRLVPPIVGVTEGSFIVPEIRSADPTQFIRLRLTVTNDEGAEDTTSIILRPVVATVSVDTNFPGLQVRVGPDVVTAPVTTSAAVGGQLLVSAPRRQVVGNATYEFSGWTDSGGRTHRVDVQGDTSLIAVYDRVSQRPVEPPGFFDGELIETGTLFGADTASFGTTPLDGNTVTSSLFDTPATDIFGQPTGSSNSLFA